MLKARPHVAIPEGCPLERIVPYRFMDGDAGLAYVVVRHRSGRIRPGLFNAMLQQGPVILVLAGLLRDLASLLYGEMLDADKDGRLELSNNRAEMFSLSVKQIDSRYATPRPEEFGRGASAR